MKYIQDVSPGKMNQLYLEWSFWASRYSKLNLDIFQWWNRIIITYYIKSSIKRRNISIYFYRSEYKATPKLIFVLFHGQKYFSDKNTKVIINPQVLQSSSNQTIFSFYCMKMSVRWSPINIELLYSFLLFQVERFSDKFLVFMVIKVVITLHISVSALSIYYFWDRQRWSLC